MTPLLEARAIVKEYRSRRSWLRREPPVLRAVDGVDLELDRSETLALVGESGSGKTTLARCLLRLVEPTAGELRFAGRDLLALAPAALRAERRRFQMVFQDPQSSLNPRLRIGPMLAEPVRVHRLRSADALPARVEELLAQVGLPPAAARQYPHEFSGGQRQRIGIARALATEPDLLVADEPVSALDVSVRAQIVNLLVDLQRRHGLALLFIGHDLAVVEHLADRVAVMYRGRIVEEAPVRALFATPRHPYTRALLAAVPRPEPGRRRPPPVEPAGERAGREGETRKEFGWAACAYRWRCPRASERCEVEAPRLAPVGNGHRTACFHPEEIRGEGGRNFSPEDA